MAHISPILRKRKPNNPYAAKNPHRVVRYFVNDGRDTAGIIELSGNYYLAYDSDGEIVGRFHSLQVAVRALPARKSP
jgi:hypothetical protein